MAKTNRFNLHKLLKPIRLVLVGILALVFVVLPSVNSPATTPEAAYISHIKGSELFIGTGTSNSREAAHVSNEVQGNRILYVPGGRRGSAHLSFIHDWPIESAGLVVQAGPDDVASQWSFPCTAGGRFTMNWKKGSDRGCEEGVRLTATEARSQGQADPNGEDFFGSKGVLRTGTGGGFTLGGKEVFTAQAGGEEVIVSPPNSEDVTIQTRSSDTGIEVDTIFSDILVKSAKHPQGRLIPEGQKYSYPQDTTMPIDRNAIINSPEMQDFLNPNNWLFPGLPENVANDLAQQVGEMRTALESVPPSPVAAQPTPSQPTAAQPTPSQPTAAQPTPSQPAPTQPASDLNLTGQWQLETGTFGPECYVSNLLEQFPVSFNQSGNQFTASGGTVLISRGNSPVNIGNGTLSGNRFESQSDLFQWIGTVSDDGNLITGTVTCQMGGGGTGRGTLNFTMKRVSP